VLLFSLFTLRITVPGSRKGSLLANNPATESTCAQGIIECCNPSRGDLKPPLRLQAAFSHPREDLRTIGDLLGFLIKSDRK